MKKAVILISKILGGLVATGILVLVAIVWSFHLPSVQQRLLRHATTLLSEHLDTKVQIDSVSVSLFGEDVSLQGLTVWDHQQRPMLQLEHVGVNLDLWKLARRQIRIKEATVRGLDALLLKPASDSDSVANYQFVLEAFKSKKAKPAEAVQDTTVKKKKLTLDISNLKLERIHVDYNTQQYELGSLHFRKSWLGKEKVTIREVKTAFVKQTKKGPVDNNLRIGSIDIEPAGDYRQVLLDSVCFRTDNHKPRKNVGKPKRGFFDAGHLDVVAQLLLHVNHVSKDSVVATLMHGNVIDRGSGLNVTDLRLHVVSDLKALHLSQLKVRMPHTRLSIDTAYVVLPSKKQGRPLRYSTSLIKGQTQLRDISRPFARALKDFTMPLNLQVLMSGDNNSMRFRAARVSTVDRSLTVSASGNIRGLKDKYKLQVHFDVHNMTTTGIKAEQVINQFAVKKFMMKQLEALGTITYQGSFDVLWKKELFRGSLQTTGGPIDFQFGLDELNKYLYGTARTTGLALGHIMDMPDIGTVACQADFRFDISKPRTAKMRQLKGGKLPIGQVEAEVDEAQYKKIKVRNIHATIQSDGAEAQGNLVMKGGRIDLLCSFSFTNTNEMKKTKIKPGIKFHKLSDEDKASREERREKKKQEKADRKALKAAEKAQRDADKAAAKAQRDAEKAVEKAERDAEKAAKKAAKAERKAAKKAAKERLRDSLAALNQH